MRIKALESFTPEEFFQARSWMNGLSHLTSRKKILALHKYH